MDDCDSWKCAKAFVKGAGSRMLLCFLPHCLISSSEHVFLSCPSSPGFPPPSSDWHRNGKLCGPTSSLLHRACPWYLLSCHLCCFQGQCLLPYVPSAGTFSHDCHSVGIWAPALEAFCCNQWLLLPGVNITFHWGPRLPNPQSPNPLLALGLQPLPALQPPSQIPRLHLLAPTHAHLGLFPTLPGPVQKDQIKTQWVLSFQQHLKHRKSHHSQWEKGAEY